MNQTFASIIHAAPKMDVEELMKVRKQLSAVLDDKFVKECDTNKDLVNQVVSIQAFLYLTFFVFFLDCRQH